MKRTSIVLLPFFIAFFSCSNPAGIGNEAQVTSSETVIHTCPDFSYFYNQEKVPLQINPEVLLVGFTQDQKPDDQRSILERFDAFAELTPDQHSAAGTFAIVKLKSNTTCPQVLTLIKELQQLPEVTFANPAFKPPHTLDPGYSWVGLTSEFIVTLKSAADSGNFHKDIAETNTRIADTLGETTFLVQAAKTSKGNSLEMANYFQNQPYVKTAEPDFFLAGIQN